MRPGSASTRAFIRWSASSWKWRVKKRRSAVVRRQSTLEEQAVIDLKPMASSARKSIEAAIADFQKQADGVKVEASVTGIRLAAIVSSTRRRCV